MICNEGTFRDVTPTLATYDEPVRFNIVLIDSRLCVAQPYLPTDRGVDSPTFLIRRRPDEEGIFATGRFLTAQLYQISPHNPLLLAVTATGLAIAALVACLIPARRATRVDPIIALRYE